MPGEKEKEASLESFRSLEQEIYLSLQRSSVEKSRQVDELLQRFGVTQPQYNVLRILKGAGPDGLGRNEIRARMLHPTSDMTRLLSRMVLKEWVRREAHGRDRRESPTHIAAAGKSLLQRIEKPLAKLHAEQFAEFSEAELRRLLKSLGRIRSGL